MAAPMEAPRVGAEVRAETLTDVDLVVGTMTTVAATETTTEEVDVHALALDPHQDTMEVVGIAAIGTMAVTDVDVVVTTAEAAAQEVERIAEMAHHH